MEGQKINLKTQQLIIIMLGVIAIADVIAMITIPHIVESESALLALIMIISTITGGFIGVLQNKPPSTSEEGNNETGNETP